MAQEIDYHQLLLQLIGSLSLADHMGDVANDVDVVLKRLGYDLEWDELSELQGWCHQQGITTLHNTPLG